MSSPKHISKLSTVQRAMADQSIREAMLAIVVAQGKPVTIPIEDLNAISKSHRLVIAVDHKAGVVCLTAEGAGIVEPAKPGLVVGSAAGKLN